MNIRTASRVYNNQSLMTSVQALMQSFLIINALTFFPSVRNTNNSLIVIGLLQVVHAVQAAVVGIFKNSLEHH